MQLKKFGLKKSLITFTGTSDKQFNDHLLVNKNYKILYKNCKNSSNHVIGIFYCVAEYFLRLKTSRI